MKIVITGHTEGIGLALANAFSKNHTVIGFSRSTGYDIADFESRNAIIEQSIGADVFINNAYDPVGQTELLKEMISAWEGSSKTIINISSKLVFFQGDSPFNEYIEQKKIQNNIMSTRHTCAHPRLLNVMPGVVNTRMSAAVFDCPSIETTELADLIYFMYSHPTIAVQELIVDVPNLDWSDIKYV